MAVSPLDTFLELTRKSGLIEPTRLGVYLEKLAAVQGVPSDPKDLIDCMIRDAMICQFQADQLLAGKWRGFYVGKYKVLERIGIGGMGQVYLAEHRTMRRRVAIKVLPRAKSAEASALERFDREARAGGTLDHPNFVRSYDRDQEGDLHYLVMEFVDGSSIAEIVKVSGPMDPMRAVHYMLQTAHGLDYAHNFGLIHRDIKPANLLVNRQGVVKILDMGLARFYNDQEDNITRKYDETVLGTADYLAPEQAIDSHAVDTRADLYSLGCTFYFGITGSPPFDEGSISQKLLWHQTRKPRSIKEVRPEVPEHISDVIDKLLAKKKEDRYATAAELIQELAPYAELKIPPPTEEELPKLSPLARRIIATMDGLGQPTVPVQSEEDSRNRVNLGASTGPARGGDSSTVNMLPDSGSQLASPPPNPAMERAVPIRTGPSMPIEPLPDVSPFPTAVRERQEASSTPRPVASDTNPFADFNMRARPATPPPPLQDRKSTPPPKPVIQFKQPATAAQPPKAATNRPKQQGYALPPKKNPAGKPPTLPATAAVPLGSLPKQVPPTPTGRRSIWPLVILAGASTLILAGLLLFVLWPKKPGQTTNEPKTKTVTSTSPGKEEAKEAVRGPKTFRVARQKVADIDHTTISAAVKDAKPGDTIHIVDHQVYEESLDLSKSTLPIKLTIQADIAPDGKRARLVPPEGHNTETPLLHIANSEQLIIRGLLIDGNDQVRRAVLISGRNKGLILEDLRIESFVGSGVELDNAQAVQKRDSELNKLWIRSRRKGEASAFSALSFTAPEGGNCDGLVLRNSLLEGPFQHTIAVHTAVQRVMVEKCKFFGKATSSLLLSENLPAKARLNLIMQNNTVYQAESSLHIASTLDADQGQITVRNLLLFQVGKVLSVEVGVKSGAGKFTAVLSGMGNVYDNKVTQPGDATLFPMMQFQTMPVVVSTAPADFLQYPGNSPLATAGEGGQPVGANEN